MPRRCLMLEVHKGWKLTHDKTIARNICDSHVVYTGDLFLSVTITLECYGHILPPTVKYVNYAYQTRHSDPRQPFETNNL